MEWRIGIEYIKEGRGEVMSGEALREMNRILKEEGLLKKCLTCQLEMNQRSMHGLMHGDTMCRCVCSRCAVKCVGKPCPRCGERVEGHMVVNDWGIRD